MHDDQSTCPPVSEDEFDCTLEGPPFGHWPQDTAGLLQFFDRMIEELLGDAGGKMSPCNLSDAARAASRFQSTAILHLSEARTDVLQRDGHALAEALARLGFVASSPQSID